MSTLHSPSPQLFADGHAKPLEPKAAVATPLRASSLIQKKKKMQPRAQELKMPLYERHIQGVSG